jgi:hypothetical protein
MTAVHNDCQHNCDLHKPVRNHYFYGKLLDTHHFELETGYFNSKRWLLNRLVSGYGVVCGLNVELADAEDCVLDIYSGLAIDKHGREVVVPCEQTFEVETPEAGSEPVEAKHEGKDPADDCPRLQRHLLLYYHECLAEPAPVHTSDCDHIEPCEPSAVHERFKLKVGRGLVPSPCSPLQIDDLIKTRFRDRSRRGGGSIEIDYKFCHEALVELVSQPCANCQDDPCIPLANFSLVHDSQSGKWKVADVDITIRPIVYSNDLLFQLMMSLMYDPPNYQNVK